MRKLFGVADCQFYVHYSEDTGYLWTDEDLKIGGHDLLAELKSYEGQFLILEIDVYEDHPATCMCVECLPTPKEPDKDLEDEND